MHIILAYIHAHTYLNTYTHMHTYMYVHKHRFFLNKSKNCSVSSLLNKRET